MKKEEFLKMLDEKVDEILKLVRKKDKKGEYSFFSCLIAFKFFCF